MVASYSVLERSVSPSVFNIQVRLAGLNEVFDAGRMVLNTSKMKGSPSVVVAHVHVDASQIGSLKCHLVPLERRLK